MAPSVMAGFLIEGRTFFTRDSTDLRPTVLVISADRARPSRSRSSLMNFLSDCWYRLHAVTATPISTRASTPRPISQPMTPPVVAVHPCAVAPNVAGSCSPTRKPSGANSESGFVGAPQWIRPARNPASRYAP